MPGKIELIDQLLLRLTRLPRIYRDFGPNSFGLRRAPHPHNAAANLWNSRNFGDESSSKECRIRSLAGLAVILTELAKFC